MSTRKIAITETNATETPAAAGEQAKEHRLNIGSDEALHYWTLGERTNAGNPRPVLVMQHGMRDVGRCLLPIAKNLADHYYCVMPDLRGHGKSFKPGSYAIEHFLMDLRRLHHSLNVQSIHLLGHSLGGHISARYAGLYPGEVESLIVVEGLGPPRWEMQQTPELTRLAAQLESAIATAEQSTNPRVLPDIETAAQRLKKNNPRLSNEWALQLAIWGTVESPDASGLLWAFDARAQEVFLGVSDTKNFDYWRAVNARTLVVMGNLGHTYWQQQFLADGYTGRFSDAELQERLDALSTTNNQTKHVVIAQAGHQVHYDEPDALALAVRDFLVPPA